MLRRDNYSRDSICVYAGQTATDEVDCINRDDEFEDYEFDAVFLEGTKLLYKI